MKIQERTGAGNNRSAVSAPAGVGERLPTAPRERKPALAALAVLLILAGALGATVLVLRAGDRIEVVKVVKEIPAGESPKANVNIKPVMVAEDSGIKYVKWSARATLEKYKAKSTIPAGSVAVGQMFAAKEGLPSGKATVGLSLKEGQYPANIRMGDTVAVYRVAGNGSSNSRDDKGSSGGSTAGRTPIVPDALVSTKIEKSDSTISTGNLSITLLVDRDDAAAVTNAATLGEAAVVIVPADAN
ncbi:hypothetical protein [Streptomyces flavofungini]|uniref:hypothetical protein n=1 Tax=Streptomyces flavofungini TaxID=68200 RepID=UPI0025B232D6|nr:hypothetical protein [Streptomyces flavofungini]WJV46901.1 hypothetical protein QUY26_16025 [Streptomyces flavofungini]